MAPRNEGFERLKKIIASKEEEEEEPPDEARRKVDECLFGENSYNEIFYKTLLGMRGELMDYLDSNPEDDSLTATIRSAIVGVTQAEEVYEMMVEMNRIGFEDSDCEDQEEHSSTCVGSKVSETTEEPAEAERLLPAFSITDEVVIDHTLKPRADETIDDMNLAINGAKKLWEYVVELRAEDGVRIGGYIELESKDDETERGLKDDRESRPDGGELTSKVLILGATNQDSPHISKCGEEPIIEGRVFDIGKDTRPMESNKEVDLEVSPATLYVEIPVSSETLPGTKRDYDSEPINPGKHPGEWLKISQNHNEDEGSGCSSAKESDPDNRGGKPDIEDLQPGVPTLAPPARSPANFARPDEEPIDEMSLAILGERMLLEYVEGSRPCDNVRIKSYFKPEQQDEDVDEGIQINHGIIPDNETSTPKVNELTPFNQVVPCITTTGGEPVMEGRMFDVGKDTRPMETDGVAKLKESPGLETIPDHGLNIEESYTTPDKGTPVSFKPLPKAVKDCESEPIQPGKDPGTLSNLAPDSKEEENSSCSKVWKLKGTKLQETEKPDISEWESPRTTRLTYTSHLSGTEGSSANPDISPKTDVTHESIPIDPGKDPGIRDKTTTGTWKIRRSNDVDTEARKVKDKSGGKPFISNKQLKPGWDPPKTSLHGRVFDEGGDIEVTDVVEEKEFKISLPGKTYSSNGKTRGVEMLNEDGFPVNGKTMENGDSMKNVVFINDLKKDSTESLRPSHKLKEKVNSKCSRAWRVKNPKCNEAWMVKIKSGGKPLVSNKRLKRGWDPPAIYSF